jgi:hypothetical protein
MIQIKSKTVAHSNPDFSSNAVTLSSVLPKIKFTLKVRSSSDGSCTSIFCIYIKTGSVVELGAKITDEFKTMNPFQSRVSFRLELSCSQKIHQLGQSLSNLILSSSLKRQKLAQ